MNKPMLKVGDRFIYTAKMNRDKMDNVGGGLNNCNADILIGRKLTVTNISGDESYVVSEDRRFNFYFQVIDDNLRPKHPRFELLNAKRL